MFRIFNGKIILIVIFISIVFSLSCKKYKENMLILEPPYIAIERWKNLKIQYIKVDDVDCTAYYKQKVPLFNKSYKSFFDYSSYYSKKAYIEIEDNGQMVGSINLPDARSDKCDFELIAFPITKPKNDDWIILKLNRKEFKAKKFDKGKVYEVYLAR